MIFEWRELTHKKYGTPVAGCWAWHHGSTPMCDHEHDEFDPTCEDATIEMSNIRAKALTNPGTTD